MFFAPLLRFDRALRACDLVLAPGPRGLVLAIDRTAVTPMLASLGVDRRARPDDALPDGSTEGSVAAGINPRRGWSGDALNRRRLGSRAWLLERAKQTQETRVAAEDYAREALAAIEADHGVTMAVEATWLRRNLLGLRCACGPEAVTVPVRVGA